MNGTRTAASQSSCRRRAFKTGVRDLVAKLKTFRYEGERRLRLIADYANSKECRSVFIRRYFGEEYPPRCGTCDRCRADRVVAEHASPAPIESPEKWTAHTGPAPVTCQERATATPTCSVMRTSAIAGALQYAYFNGCRHRQSAAPSWTRNAHPN